MISFDTFSGPRGRVREAELDPHGLLVLAEQPKPFSQLFPAADESEESDEFYESQDDDNYDLFHEQEQDNAGQEREQEEMQNVRIEQNQEQARGGRIRQLVELLTLQSHNVGDARSALVNKLLNVVKVNELLLSRATEEQIASAANDAITDEMMESVDQEDRRRSELALQELPVQVIAVEVSASTLFDSGHLFKVLELVDVLDSTTGGMVKSVLTKVRQRAPLNARMERDNEMEKGVEFCRFCSAYGDHTAVQHRCRLCGIAGHHRSRSCPRRDTAGLLTLTSTSNSNIGTSSSTEDQKFCTLCNSWGRHITERHRCRGCGAHGAHRSHKCAAASSSSLVPWIGTSADFHKGRRFCCHCGAWRPHASDEHRCRLCGVIGDHGSKNCFKRNEGVSPGGNRSRYSHHGDDTSPAMSPVKITVNCSFCRRKAGHTTHEHLCRVCHAVGLHRSDDCTQRSSSNTVLSYSVDAASKVRDRVLEKIPRVLPPPASSLVWRSLDKVGDADLILRKTLQRIGVWGGGSQTPITTPYAPVSSSCSGASETTIHDNAETAAYLESPLHGLVSESSSSSSSAPLVLDEGRSSGVYVLSYAEGSSMVPARFLKYMRLLMHHEVSTNAFSVVVRFDPRPSHWELMKPGMVSPRSLPSSPTLSHQLQQRMAHYTLQTLLGAKGKLRELEIAQCKVQRQQQTQFRPLRNHTEEEQIHAKRFPRHNNLGMQVEVIVDS